MIRRLEIAALGPLATRRAARLRRRAVCEAEIRLLVQTRGEPGSRVDRERASRPALQREAQPRDNPRAVGISGDDANNPGTDGIASDANLDASSVASTPMPAAT